MFVFCTFSLRQVDVEFMRRLQNKVNIVPVIAKADALTASELTALKARVMSDLDRYKIDIYRLPECDSDEEDEIKRLDQEIKVNVSSFLLLKRVFLLFYYLFLYRNYLILFCFIGLPSILLISIQM